MTLVDDSIISKLTGYLGLAMKAGQIITGQDMCLKHMRKRLVKIVFVDENISKGSFKKIENASKEHEIPILKLNTGVLSKSIGKESRTVAALLPGSFTDIVLKQIEKTPLEPNNNKLKGGRINE